MRAGAPATARREQLLQLPDGLESAAYRQLLGVVPALQATAGAFLMTAFPSNLRQDKKRHVAA